MNAVLPEAIARQRFRIVLLFRVYGIALAVLGMVLWRTDWVGTVQPLLGRLVLLAGVLDVVLLPRLLGWWWRRTAG